MKNFQLENNIALNKTEIQTLFNQIEDHALQMENEAVSEEDSITEDASDDSEHNFDFHIENKEWFSTPIA